MESAHEGQTCNILSYNLFCRPTPIRSKHHSDHKDDRLEQFAELCLSRPYDILCLQEIFGGVFNINDKRKKKFIQSLVQLGYTNAFHSGQTVPIYSSNPSSWSISPFDGGLVTLSKYEIIQSQELIFTECCLPDSFSRKGCLFTRMKISEDCCIDVYNTHLQANEGKSKDKVRDAQILDIMNFILNYSFSNPECHYPVFLCGDFNVDANSRAEITGLLNKFHNFFEVEHEINTIDTIDPLHQNQSLITYGDGTDAFLTPPEFKLLRARYDYIFYFFQPKSQLHPVTLVKSGIDKMLVTPSAARPYDRLSDHYGVFSSLFVKNAITTHQ